MAAEQLVAQGEGGIHNKEKPTSGSTETCLSLFTGRKTGKDNSTKTHEDTTRSKQKSTIVGGSQEVARRKIILGSLKAKNLDGGKRPSLMVENIIHEKKIYGKKCLQGAKNNRHFSVREPLGEISVKDKRSPGIIED